MPIVLKSGNLKLLEPSGPVQVCNGIVLHFTSQQKYGVNFKLSISVAVENRKQEFTFLYVSAPGTVE